MSEPATPKGEISLLGDHFDRSVALQDEEEAMMLEFSDATASPALAAAPQEQAAAAPIPNSYGPDYLPGDLTCVALASGTVEFDEQDMVALGEAVMNESDVRLDEWARVLRGAGTQLRNNSYHDAAGFLFDYRKRTAILALDLPELQQDATTSSDAQRQQVVNALLQAQANGVL